VENLANSSVSSIVIGILVVAYSCYRQLQTRTVREDRGSIIFVVLLVIGLYQAFTFAEKHEVGAEIVIITIGSLIVGLALGVLRGVLVHVWRAGGKLYRRGNATTIVIWVVGIAIHLAVEFLSQKLDRSAQGLASSTLLIYIALSIGAQRFIVLRRAKTIEEHPDEAPTHY
jgi:hypothetical protein